MLAPFALPFQITAAIFIIVWITAALILRTPKRVQLLRLFALLLIIPSCAAIRAIVDSYRFGRFEYISTHDLPENGYIELPASATNIVLYRDGTGHRVRFSIRTESLREWIDERRGLRPDLNKTDDDDEWKMSADLPADELRLQQALFSKRFPGTGWVYDPTMIELHVSRSDRGGGYGVWHVPSSGETYLSANYW